MRPWRPVHVPACWPVSRLQLQPSVPHAQRSGRPWTFHGPSVPLERCPITRRCSGLAALAAELHIVMRRPTSAAHVVAWLRCVPLPRTELSEPSGPRDRLFLSNAGHHSLRLAEESSSSHFRAVARQRAFCFAPASYRINSAARDGASKRPTFPTGTARGFGRAQVPCFGYSNGQGRSRLSSPRRPATRHLSGARLSAPIRP